MRFSAACDLGFLAQMCKLGLRDKVRFAGNGEFGVKWILGGGYEMGLAHGGE